MLNTLIGTMPNRDPAEEQARQIIERLGLSGQIPAFNESLPQTGGYGAPATPMPGMNQQSAYTGGLTPQQSAMVMDATAQPEQQAYDMVNRLLGSTQADAFANRDKNAAYNMIANHPALGQAQADAFMNRGKVNRLGDMEGVIGTNAQYQNGIANGYTGGGDFEMPQQKQVATASPTDYYGLGSGFVAANPAPEKPYMNDGRGASEVERGGAWGGIQGNPFYMGERPAPGHQLGYTGSFMGSSRGWTDDSEGRAWDARAARNLEINRMLGNQDIARQANATDALRTMLNVDQRREYSLDRKEGKMWDTISKTPEGQRKGIIAKGIQEGVIPQDVGRGMMVDEVLKRSTTGTRSKEGVINMPAFLAKLQSEWDPNTMDGTLLIEKLQALGVTPDMVDRYKTDPTVGAFAQRLLGPPVIKKEYGLNAVINNVPQDLSAIRSKLSRLIYGE